ncbi:hypothetical protein EYF80_048346 [Liparis tanakae]|uniref:Uncharacterized protein n=1 Tax=Liparis tanakae TaxID=230148 RepID=A0A4Z2FK12_9TELE|nr:hypothetical protein EYF80_048346 [Liparis tanakae]
MGISKTPGKHTPTGLVKAGGHIHDRTRSAASLPSFTFSPALGGGVRLLQRTQQVVQQVQEALQHATVTQGALADAGQEHEDPGRKREEKNTADVGEELAPPALAAAELHQQQAGVETDLRSPADAKVFEELLAGLGMEGTLEHRGHRVA